MNAGATFLLVIGLAVVAMLVAGIISNRKKK